MGFYLKQYFNYNALIIKVTRLICRKTKDKAGDVENSSEKDFIPLKGVISIPSSSSYIEKGQGDGLHNCLTESPSKKSKLDEVAASPKIVYVSATGQIEFFKKSTKKLQTETKWSRPCKLEFAYSGSSKEDLLLYLIIYEGNTKCRRNLLKEFEAEESTNE